jgi:superfamily II DNA/RNA helicase
MSTFADLGVPAPLCATLARRGISQPFPIQEATVPDALAGRDVAGKAPTGSGKTLAFGLAIAAQAIAAGRPEPRRPRALVLVPTRELAAQVRDELASLVDERRHGAVAAVYGGVGYGPQRKLLVRGVSAVVACPGRLEDLVSEGDVRLDGAELVVLDEADRMADMGFMPAVRRLLDRTPDDRQTLLFSATLDGDVDALVRRYQRDPAHHAAAGAEEGEVEVPHHAWSVDRAERVGLAADIARRVGSTIVFTRTRHGADRVARQLARFDVKAVAIHGRRTQGQRDQALRSFSTGRAPVLVATDVAARGIHVDAVGCVVHFDLPDDPKDYVHRSGRTGRAGAAGTVVALVIDDAAGRKDARTLWKALGRAEPIVAADVAVLPEAAPAPARPATEPSPKATTSTTTARGGTRTDAGGRRNGARHTGSRRDGSRGEDARGGRRDDRRGDAGGRHAHGRRGATRRGADARGGRRGDDRSVSGTVSSYNPNRGYGFISRRGGADVFVHVSALGGNELRPGQRVRFELVPGRRGQQAHNVRPVG